MSTNKADEREWMRIRFLTFHIAKTGFLSLPKHITIDRWWPLDGKAVKSTAEQARQRYIDAGIISEN